MKFKVLKSFGIFLAIVFVLSETAFLLFPQIVNLDNYKTKICSIISKELGTTFSYESVNLKTYPNFSIKLFVSKPKLDGIYEADNFETKMGLFGLICKKVSLKTFYTENPKLSIVRYKDNTTNLDYILSQPMPVDLTINRTFIDITNYQVIFKDELVNKTIKVTGEQFKAKTKHNQMFLEIKSEITDGSDKAIINLNIEMPKPDIKNGFKNSEKYIIATGRIKNLKPGLFKEYIKLYFDKDLENITGTINADFIPTYENKELKRINVNIRIDDLKKISKVKENSVIFDKKTRIKSTLVINDKNLNIERFEFSGERFKIFLSGIIKNFKNKKTKLDLDLDIKDTRTEALYWMVPSTVSFRDNEIRKLKNYGFYADTTGHVEIKGNCKKPNLFGKIDLTNVWILDGLEKDVPKAIIKIGFNKDKIDIDTQIWGRPTEYVIVKGWSKIYTKDDNKYHITSTDKVPLETVQKVLPPISDVAGFDVGPVPFLRITGLGNIDLWTSGSVDKPSLNGRFNYIDAKAGFIGLNADIYNAYGHVDFKGTKIYFYTDKGFMFGQKASINGISDVKGNIDFDANIVKAPLKDLINVLKTSQMLAKESKQVSMIESAQGTADFYLKLKGRIKDFSMEIIDEIEPSGEIKLYDSNIFINNPKAILSKMNGIIKFGVNYTKFNCTTNFYESPLEINGEIKENTANLNINSPKMKLVDATKFIIESGFIPKIKGGPKEPSTDTVFNFSMKYKGNIQKIDFKKIDLNAIFTEKNTSKSLIDVLSGKIHLKNGDLDFDNMNLIFLNTKVYLNGKVKNYMEKPNANINISLKQFDLKMLNNKKTVELFPIKYQKVITAYKDFDGVVTSDIKVNNNNISGKIWLRDISFIHAILGYPFSIKSSDISLKNNSLNLNSFSASFAGTPIFLYGSIDNFIKSPKYNITFTSKLSSNFVNNYINTHLTYPILVKGEVQLSSQIKGDNNCTTYLPTIKLEENADISYLGAKLGDENSQREITGEIKKYPDKLEINNFNYSKYIYSQNNRLYPLDLVKINAEIEHLTSNRPYIKKASIKTINPVSASIFNIFFKKSLIKNGLINCDLNIKDYIDKPNITGILDLKNIDIPLYDIFIDEVKTNFESNDIIFSTKAKYMESDIAVDSKLKPIQNEKLHFTELNIKSKKTDINYLLNYFNEISYLRPIQNWGNPTTEEKSSFNTENIIIDNGTWEINNLTLRTLTAKNFKAILNLKNNNLKVNDISFEAANGKIDGNFEYNFDNAKIKTKMQGTNVDANTIATEMLDIENQIFGKLNGYIDITTHGATDEDRIKHLSGNIKFEVTNGRMPKLGSLEYLLRAGNLIKSGIRGLTINNLAGILIPYGSGNFDNINGNLTLTEGVAKNIKISSKGKYLSILMMGNFDIVNTHANISVLGKLSKNIDSILGPIGNASLNSFFNLIPGINLDANKDTDLIKLLNSIPELSLKSKKFRYFRAKIDGDISSEKFVSIFEWIDK